MPPEKPIEELVADDPVTQKLIRQIAKLEAMKARRKIALMRRTKVGRSLDGPWREKHESKIAETRRLLLEISQYSEERKRLDRQVEGFDALAKSKLPAAAAKQLNNENLPGPQNGTLHSPEEGAV